MEYDSEWNKMYGLGWNKIDRIGWMDGIGLMNEIRWNRID